MILLEACLEAIKQRLIELVLLVKDRWNSIKELCSKVEFIEISKTKYVVPKTIVLKSQVLNRKPTMFVARSSC